METPQVRAAVGKRSNVGPAAVIAKQKNDLRSDRQSSDGLNVLVTVHPSAILRREDKETRQAEFERFVEDLKKVVVSLDRSLGKKD